MAPWFNDTTQTCKRKCRKLERKWRMTNLEVHRLAWDNSIAKDKHSLSGAKMAYYSHLLNSNKNNPRFLFDTVARLTRKHRPSNSAPFSANDFNEFFVNKIDSIRNKITSIAQPVTQGSGYLVMFHISETKANSILSNFNTIILETFTNLVISSKSTTCVLDVIPTKLFKELLPILAPPMLNIINHSLSTGLVPYAFKTAIINLLLKKTDLNPEVLTDQFQTFLFYPKY